MSALLREGTATARAQPITSLVAALIIAAVCGVVITTTGQSAASEARVISEVEAAGSRTLVFSDPAGSGGLTAEHLDAIAALDGVDWILALGPPRDTANAALGDGGNPISLRAIYSSAPPILRLTQGRAAASGEAIIGSEAARRAGLSDVAGYLSNDQSGAAVVGVFTAGPPLQSLNETALVRQPQGPRAPMQTLIVLARSPQSVGQLEQIIPRMLRVSRADQVSVASPGVLADLQRVVSGEVGANGRRLMILILMTGLMLVAVTQYGATVARRRDFGRRRALGASRVDLMLLVLIQGLLSASLGAVVGSLGGVLVLRAIDGQAPPLSFILGVAVLGVLAALVGSALPAVAAARTDPVRILRVA